ncbi:MAG: FAD-dependent oxidoreductase [Chloroflexota bacterium]|nr:MAG: FAD-dependent oxidoreductase [Chloroflexota bacterium]
MGEKFDVIVVGAGLAGLACAYALAREEIPVLVVERGDYPGAKNVSGGRIYTLSLDQLLPGLWDDAPFERHVNRELLCFMNGEASVSVELFSSRFGTAPYHSHSVLRGTFDQWLASKVEESGGLIVTKMKVDELATVDGRVCGVRSAGDTVDADVVVLADGVNSLLARKLGLLGRPHPKHCAVAAKEIIELPRGTIEDRFNLEGNEGAAMLMVGFPSCGAKGGGFLYTNRESLSLGLVVEIAAAMGADFQVSELTERLKSHPTIKRLVKGGRTVEYAAHLIPEAAVIPQTLVGDGVLVVGDAAGLCLNMGLTVRGMDYAIASGALAARAIKEAREAGDLSRAKLSRFDRLLRGSFVGRDFGTFGKAQHLLDNQRLYRDYPDLACAALEQTMFFNGSPKERFSRAARREITSRVSVLKLLGDALGGYRML